MKKYYVIYSDDAIADLDEIYCYIAFHLKERRTAWNLTSKIRRYIRDLATQAEMCERVDWEPWFSMGVRRMPVGNFLVFYLPDNTSHEVKILRIFYGGRDVEHIIGEE